VGNLVLGKKTYNMILQYPAMKQALAGVEIVILSETETQFENNTVVTSPEHAISYLKEKGFDQLFIGGGTATYNSFLARDLVTTCFEYHSCCFRKWRFVW
jgi:dihydrofolate reductase